MFQIGLIFTNFISWIKFNKKMFFILLINLSLVAGVIIYLFSFNNNLIYSKVTTIRDMTYGRTYTVQGEMDADEVYGTVDNFINNDKLPEIEFAYFSGMPDIGGKKGKATAVNFYKDEIKGHYYDEKYDINDSGKVALATDTNINVLYGTDLNKDTKSININGKYYTVEYTKEQFIDSMEHLAGLVLVRLSYDDFSGNISPITEFIIVFEERLDEVQEKAFRSEIRKLKNLEQIIVQPKETSDKKNYKIEDKWIISRANKAAKDVKDNLDKFELGLAAQRVYDFIWNEYCDWYIEMVKPRLYGKKGADKDTARFVLMKVLKNIVKLLHPFMPFITEEIWSYLPDTDSRLIKSEWPLFKEEENFEEAEGSMEFIMEAVRSIRNIRAEMNVAPSRKSRLVFIPNNYDVVEFIKLGVQHFYTLANITEVSIVSDKRLIGEDTASSVIDGTEIYLPLSDLIDYEKETERLEKEKSKLEGELQRVHNKLNNEKFMSKAPENVVNDEKEKLAKYQSMMDKVTERLEQLKKK